jgi:hypothetical protein
VQVRLVATLPTGLTGAAGEYYVAAELSLRGWLATVTIKNAPDTDVLARNLASGRLVAIQTKTASVGNKFTLGLKDEVPTETENEWYVLVSLQGLDVRPAFFVIPRNHVAAALYADHHAWLARPARSGAPHVDNPRRTMPLSDIEGYRERWELLSESTATAPLLLGPRHPERMREIGLPPGLPGLKDF